MHPAVRWLARLTVVAIALWFIADGLRGTWGGAGALATGMVYTGVVLGVCCAVFALVELARRGRG
jgi:hypothetical protein